MALTSTDHAFAMLGDALAESGGIEKSFARKIAVLYNCCKRLSFKL